MDDLYKQLGFTRPPFLENSYGIRIYIGSKNKDDWCVVIPKNLIKTKFSHFNFDRDYAIYLITEQEALSIAKEYTELARKFT